jgi:hypothetical protein
MRGRHRLHGGPCPRLDRQDPDSALRPRANPLEVGAKLRIVRIVAAGRHHVDVRGRIDTVDHRARRNADFRIDPARPHVLAGPDRDAVTDHGAGLLGFTRWLGVTRRLAVTISGDGGRREHQQRGGSAQPRQYGWHCVLSCCGSWLFHSRPWRVCTVDNAKPDQMVAGRNDMGRSGPEFQKWTRSEPRMRRARAIRDPAARLARISSCGGATGSTADCVRFALGSRAGAIVSFARRRRDVGANPYALGRGK